MFVKGFSSVKSSLAEKEWSAAEIFFNFSICLWISNLVPNESMSNSLRWAKSNSKRISPVILCAANWPATARSKPNTRAKYDVTCLGVHDLASFGFKSSVNDCAEGFRWCLEAVFSVSDWSSSRALSMSLIVRLTEAVPSYFLDFASLEAGAKARFSNVAVNWLTLEGVGGNESCFVDKGDSSASWELLE